MERRLAALKTVLEGINGSASAGTFDDRRIIQKSVYLAQVAGVKFGYLFGWYIRGPYSKSLTKDYFALGDEIASGESEQQSVEAPAWVLETLERVRDLSKLPGELNGQDLDRGDWLELLASLHYLRNNGQDPETARATLSREKSKLAPFTSLATEKLVAADLLTR